MRAKAYEPTEVEEKWYRWWTEQGFFQADADSEKPRYSMVLPPPNVTGNLHMGHALNHTLQDIISRWKRMKGFDVLWLPGTDHAGIATQTLWNGSWPSRGRDELTWAVRSSRRWSGSGRTRLRRIS